LPLERENREREGGERERGERERERKKTGNGQGIDRE
jgi:hypothetical protein